MRKPDSAWGIFLLAAALSFSPPGHGESNRDGANGVASNEWVWLRGEEKPDPGSEHSHLPARRRSFRRRWIRRTWRGVWCILITFVAVIAGQVRWRWGRVGEFFAAGIIVVAGAAIAVLTTAAAATTVTAAATSAAT